jgi:hypothetical protein
VIIHKIEHYIILYFNFVLRKDVFILWLYKLLKILLITLVSFFFVLDSIFPFLYLKLVIHFCFVFILFNLIIKLFRNLDYFFLGVYIKIH